MVAERSLPRVRTWEAVFNHTSRFSLAARSLGSMDWKRVRVVFGDVAGRSPMSGDSSENLSGVEPVTERSLAFDDWSLHQAPSAALNIEPAKVKC